MMTQPWLLPVASLVLLSAHVLRTARHSTLFPREELPRRFDLLLALAVGYLINIVAPFRFGEIVRAAIISYRLGLRFSNVAVTVAAERLTDVVVVTLIGLSFSATAREQNTVVDPTLSLLFLTAAGLVLLVIATKRSPAFRRATWSAASIFNERLAIGLLNFSWGFSNLVTSGQLLSSRYLLLSLAMWGNYLAAYLLFCRATGMSLSEIVNLLLGAPLNPLATEMLSGGIAPLSLVVLLFFSLPAIGIVIYGLVRHRREVSHSVGLIWRAGLAPIGTTAPRFSDRFHSRQDYDDFLRAHFAVPSNLISRFSIEGLDGASVQRLLPGGSDAITAQVEVNNRFLIRKFAQGESAQKLKVQAEWLKRHAGALPLAKVMDESDHSAHYRYDMPYVLEARDFYEVIHAAPAECARGILESVVNEVDRFHNAFLLGEADQTTIDRYLLDKASANARHILTYAQSKLGKQFQINDEEFSLEEWTRLLELDWLRAQIHNRRHGIVHGDLTIENIIVDAGSSTGWYIIDPNPSNIFNNPLIDWAKLSQSLNLGYEELNRGLPSRLRGRNIVLRMAKSGAYRDLSAQFLSFLSSRFDADTLREIAFHELVNYLRLTPYKIKNTPEKALTFFACTAVLLRRYGENHYG